jgi:hypothetical protein
MTTGWTCTPGFAAPILWGARMGFAPAEIAEGLEISECLVRDVISAFSGIQFPARLQRPADIDPNRMDRAYRNWARARIGASDALAGGPP